jgi:hypothetical protein
LHKGDKLTNESILRVGLDSGIEDIMADVVIAVVQYAPTVEKQLKASQQN